MQKNRHGQAVKWIFSLRDKELAKIVDANQICLKSNELHKQAKVIYNE